MKRTLLLLLTLAALSWSRPTAAQTSPSPYLTHFTPEEISRADIGAALRCSDEERQLYLLINLARTSPRKFWDHVAKVYLDTVAPNSYIASLEEDLTTMEPREPYHPDQRLIDAASYHAYDIGSSGITGHNSSDGTGFVARAKRFVQCYGSFSAGECCSFGSSNAIDIVMQLLVDEGVESHGHRNNLLSPKYTMVGLKMFFHSQYQTCCVIDHAYCSE